MKKLYLIGGTMGVGKTATCQQLKSMLSNAVLLDGDWCWDADPFVVTDETKAMVMDNICHVLIEQPHPLQRLRQRALLLGHARTGDCGRHPLAP